MALIGQAVSEEKMFEYYGDIHVYCPGVGAYEPLGSNFFGQVVSEEKMFEYYGNIHVYCPWVGAYELLGTNLFQSPISLIFSPTAHFLQDFHFK